MDIFKRSAPLYKTPLGRWNIHNYKETTLKIKYATEDNCGVSGQKNNQLRDNHDDTMFMMGYESVPVPLSNYL
jgi:hypothetical protein